jgi:hypothetical protein
MKFLLDCLQFCEAFLQCVQEWQIEVSRNCRYAKVGVGLEVIHWESGANNKLRRLLKSNPIG